MSIIFSGVRSARYVKCEFCNATKEQSFHNYDIKMNLTRTRWMNDEDPSVFSLPPDLSSLVTIVYRTNKFVGIIFQNRVYIHFRDDSRGLANSRRLLSRIVIAVGCTDRIKRARVNDCLGIFNIECCFIDGVSLQVASI